MELFVIYRRLYCDSSVLAARAVLSCRTAMIQGSDRASGQRNGDLVEASRVYGHHATPPFRGESPRFRPAPFKRLRVRSLSPRRRVPKTAC